MSSPFECLTRVRSHLAQLGISITASSLHTLKARGQLAKVIQITPGSRGSAIEGCLDETDYLTAKIEQWEERIAALATPMSAVETIVREAPGVGPVLAAMIVGEVGDIQRFHHPKAFARYAGLTPSDRSSGGRRVMEISLGKAALIFVGH